MNNSDVTRCLGFNPEKKLVKSHTSDTIAAIDHMYHSIYVYTDIITNQNVGNSKVPLLPVVPITST